MAKRKSSVEAGESSALPTRGRGRPAGTGQNGQGENKSAFVREFLNLNPSATAKEVAAAWSEKGHAEPITAGLYYQVRNKLGFAKTRGTKSGRKPAGRSARPPADAPRPRASGVDSYIEMETTLDKLIAQTGPQDMSLLEALRVARRRVSSEILRQEA
jgi:hypothetical protein